MEQRTKYVFAILGISLVVVIIVGLIFVYSGIYNVGADKTNSGFKAWLLDTVKDSSIASRASGVELPDLSGRETVLQGIKGYDGSCSGCHGRPGKKPGTYSQSLNPSAPWLGGISEPPGDQRLKGWFWATKHGIEMTGMPAWGNMKEDEEIWAIVAAMRKFPELSESDYQELVEEAKAASEQGTSEEAKEEGDESEGASDRPDAGRPDVGTDAGADVGQDSG